MSLNSEIINMFKCSHPENNEIKNKIIQKMSFLVYKNATKYKKYPNYDDLLQEGYLGLIRAVNNFDVNKFSNFFSYAEQWVMHYIIRAASKFDVVYNPNRTRVVYCEPNENEADINSSPESNFFEKERAEIMLAELEKFPDRDKNIVKTSFGINCKEKTLREIGVQYNISYEGARYIKNNILAKLRKKLPTSCGEF